MRVKNNERKEKRKYGWCASKEKNIDAVWEVVGELKHDNVHHHTRPQHSVNDARHDPSSQRRRTPLTHDGQRQLLPWLAGAVLRVPLRPHPIDAPWTHTVFLEEEDYQHGKSREFENGISETFRWKRGWRL